MRPVGNTSAESLERSSCSAADQQSPITREPLSLFDSQRSQPFTTPAQHSIEDRSVGTTSEDQDLKCLEAAHTFYDMFECKRLAVYLNVSKGGRLVSALLSANPCIPPAELAYQIIVTWRKEKGSAATTEKLQQVLREKLKKVDTVESVWPDSSISHAASQNCDSATLQRTSMTSASNGADSSTTLELSSAEHQVEETTIMDIACSFSGSFSCTQLAVFLQLTQGSGFVEDSHPRTTVREKAYDIMMEWRKENGSAATGEWLHNVLHDKLDMVDLALQFREALLGKVF